MTAPTCEPWHDTPICPLERGGMPCMGPLTAADELLGPDELWCCACGRKSAAKPEHVEQAKRADAAWEAEQDRIIASCASLRPGQCISGRFRSTWRLRRARAGCHSILVRRVVFIAGGGSAQINVTAASMRGSVPSMTARIRNDTRQLAMRGARLLLVSRQPRIYSRGEYNSCDENGGAP